MKFKMVAYRPLFTSTGLILRNVKKTAQDSYTIIIKKNLMFQLDQVQMAAYQPLFTFTWPLFGKPC